MALLTEDPAHRKINLDNWREGRIIIVEEDKENIDTEENRLGL